MEFGFDVFGLITGFCHNEGEVVLVLYLQDLLFDVADEVVEVVLELLR